MDASSKLKFNMETGQSKVSKKFDESSAMEELELTG